MQTLNEKIVPDPVLKILKDKPKVKDRRWQKPTDAAQTVWDVWELPRERRITRPSINSYLYTRWGSSFNS